MPLVVCQKCRSFTPSTATRCVHCGALPPTCAACAGTGTCSTCSGGGTLNGLQCQQCGENRLCPQCTGRKHGWALPT